MKKIFSKTDQTITFRVDGALVLEITPAGILVEDRHAPMLENRLGGQIGIETVTVKEAVKEVVKEEAPADDKEAVKEEKKPKNK